MLLTPAQGKIAEDTHRFRVLCCGRRFGKTTLAVEEIKGKAISKPSRIAYIAMTYQQSRDIAWATLKNELQGALLSVNESRLELTTKTVHGGKSDVILRGWESIETLRGQAFDFLVLDEVASMRNFLSQWQEVLRPTLTDSKGEAMFISSPAGFNHFYDLFNLQDKDSDYKSFHFTSYDNPHIPAEELDKAKLELTENRFAQEYLADFRKTEGLIYKEFRRDLHVFGELPVWFRRAERLVGIDWGYTNPAAIGVIEKDCDGHFWVTSEYYQRGKTTAELIEYARSLGGNGYYADPAEPDRNEELKRAGLNVRDVNKDVVAGIDAVRNLFKAGRIHIHSSCVNLIAELETYSYKPSVPGKNEPEEPVKEDDHMCDMLRYVLFMQSNTNERRFAQQSTASNVMAYRRTTPRVIDSR